MDNKKKQEILNKITDRIVEVPLNEWKWTGANWVTWITSHKFTIPADFLSTCKIGIGFSFTQRMDTQGMTRNYELITSIICQLKMNQESEDEKKLEALLADLEKDGK